MAIRYDPKLLQEIRRTVKNYQSKRQRVLRNGGEIIPDPASISSFLTDYTDRRTLVRDLERLKRYSKRGAEEVVTFESGVRTTRYQLSELRRMAAVSKRNITRELNQAPARHTLQPVARAYYEHKEAQYEYLSRPLSKLTSRQFKTYQRIARAESNPKARQQTFYQNIHIMVDDLTYGLPADVVQGLRDALGKLSMKQLTELMSTDPYVRSVMDYYMVMQAGGEVNDLVDKVQNITDYINGL